MRLRAQGQLQGYLNRQLVWRKKELTSLKFCVGKAALPDQPILVRAALGLLYAHWEGFIKDAAVAYVRHAAAQQLPIVGLKPHFRAIALRRQLFDAGHTSDLSTRRSFFELLDSGLGAKRTFPTHSVIRTKSNLKAGVLKDIMIGLDLNYLPFALKEKPVIDRLVSLRNMIMHGRGAAVTSADYLGLHDETVLLIDEFKTQLEAAATARAYAA